MIEGDPQVYEFDDFRLDVLKRRLIRAGETVPLYSRAFDLLLVLVKNGGRDLTKDELLDQVWPGQVLEESNLTVNISAIRRALGERAAQPRYLVTIPGRGYRFVASVRERDDELSGLVIESETISQVTVEEDFEVDVPNSIAAQPQVRQLHGKRLSVFRRPLVLISLLLGTALLLAASALLLREIRKSKATTSGFHQVTLRQLTNDGRVVTAALSPDGKFFAFVHAEKDTYSLRLGQTNGEAPIELRPSAQVVYRGVTFAPDGSSVYYVIQDGSQTRGSLHRIPVLGGVPVKLRDLDSLFAIAPDNRRVAFVRSDDAAGTRSVVISDLDGAHERTALTLPASRNLNSITLCWSPDGATIALGATPNADQTVAGIFLLNLNNAELKPLTGSLWRELERMVWLKDGSGLIAVAASAGTQEGRQVWFIELPSGVARRITNDLTSYDIGLSVTSDSKNLLAVEHQQINNIWIAPVADLSKAKQVTYGALNRGDGGLGLDWTPNGKIIYTAAVARSKTVWIMDADGGNARELTPPGAYETTPSVTGDGRFVVFDSDRSGSLEIWRANIDGSEPKQLTTCGRNSQPNATPDGKWVVYKSNCDSAGGLWRVSIEGGQPAQLTDQTAWWPWVSPDGKWVACQYLNSEAKTTLAVIPIEGGPPVKVFAIPPQANFRYGIRWTADGKAITYRDWGKGLWSQSLEGGPPQIIQGLPEEKIYSNGWSRDGKLFAFTRGTEMRDVVLISNVN